MRMYDLINMKKYNQSLTREMIEWLIKGFTEGEIPDYQMSAFLMAVYFKGMTDEETSYMTTAMAESGDMVNLDAIEGVKVDKHSTGGVGDKTTLIVAPIVAACGVKVAKMSGRGLGHTGGTIDKLESITGYKTSIPMKQFIDVVNKAGVSVIGQSGNLTPADKKIYALRDVTATTDCIPLIAASIMSKKIAAGADCIVLDVKVGSGAFMKTIDEAKKLANEMITLGKNAGRKVAALVTDMDTPLGNAIGNSLEVIEAVKTLKGEGPEDLLEVCLELASMMLMLAGKGELEKCRRMAEDAIASGEAFSRLKQMVELHGGDVSLLEDTDCFIKASECYEVKATESGYISKMDTEGLGIAAMMLGAGRATKEDTIDYSAGIILKKKTGDRIEKGDTLATIYTNNIGAISAVNDKILHSYSVIDEKVAKNDLIFCKLC